jgi:hypothetical protein
MTKTFAPVAGVFVIVLAPGAVLAAGSDSTTGALTGTIIRPILVTAVQGLQFGAIVRPSAGPGTVTLSTAGALSITGTGAIPLPSSIPQAAMFTASGEGGQSFTLTIDSSVTLTNAAAGGGTLAVATTNDAGCTVLCALPGGLGASGALTFHVGGTFAISSTTPSGLYSGTLNVSVVYN